MKWHWIAGAVLGAAISSRIEAGVSWFACPETLSAVTAEGPVTATLIGTESFDTCTIPACCWTVTIGMYELTDGTRLKYDCTFHGAA